uniref:Uncharacterized protein n=1 Tax=Glossina austeni TaxID=7395 RepID=A0A1A9UFX2_GLOAU
MLCILIETLSTLSVFYTLQIFDGLNTPVMETKILVISSKLGKLDITYTLISNILVGSSNNKRSGLENKARAKAKRIRQPPENDFVGLCCIAVSNPSPFNITEARATALSASIFQLQLNIGINISQECRQKRNVVDEHENKNYGSYDSDLLPKENLVTPITTTDDELSYGPKYKRKY